jgi:hypothetical protein
MRWFTLLVVIALVGTSSCPAGSRSSRRIHLRGPIGDRLDARP